MPAATPDKPGKIYVGNLPQAVDKSSLQEAFSSYGDINDVLLVADRETGKSRGFGFVTYANTSDADDAVNGMNEKSLMGNTLKVSHALMAISRQMRGRGDDEGGPRGGGMRGRGGPPGGPRGRGGFSPRGGFRGGPPRGRGGPPRGRGGYNGPQGPGGMHMGDEYGDEMGMGRGGRGRGGPRGGRGRGEPLLQHPPSLLTDDYRGAPPKRDEYGDPMADRGRAPPPRADYGQSSYGAAQTADPYYGGGGGREPAGEYGAGAARPPAPREYGDSRGEYAREDPYAAGRDRYGASRDPLTREPPAREPAPREESRGYSRDYESSGGRDPYAAPTRDPYSAPAAERSSYEYPAREDPYAARSAAAPAPRSAYEEPRRDSPREYGERSGADRGYGAAATYGEPASRSADPYSRAAPEREYGGSAATSRFEGYGSRDPYRDSRSDNADKAPYGSRDPYSSAGGQAAGGGSGGRGYERRY